MMGLCLVHRLMILTTTFSLFMNLYSIKMIKMIKLNIMSFILIHSLDGLIMMKSAFPYNIPFIEYLLFVALMGYATILVPGPEYGYLDP